MSIDCPLTVRVRASIEQHYTRVSPQYLYVYSDQCKSCHCALFPHFTQSIQYVQVVNMWRWGDWIGCLQCALCAWQHGHVLKRWWTIKPMTWVLSWLTVYLFKLKSAYGIVGSKIASSVPLLVWYTCMYSLIPSVVHLWNELYLVTSPSFVSDSCVWKTFRPPFRGFCAQQPLLMRPQNHSEDAHQAWSLIQKVVNLAR